MNISGDTLILDGENGYPLEAEELQAGETVYVYIRTGHDHEPAAADNRRGCHW